MFDGAGSTASGPLGNSDSNETNVSSFRIRRTELKFTMDIHENVTAVVMIDPAREATSFPNVEDNQADQSIFKRQNHVSPEFQAGINNGVGAGIGANDTGRIASVQSGAGTVNRLLQDAYINYHGVIPHHDFQVGQFKPWIGEEGIRSSAQLDFVERSFTGQVVDDYGRDLGASVHGTWWDDRFQYWLGVFDGAGNYLGSSSGVSGIPGQMQNRADDNNEKDGNYRVLVRPLWSTNDCDCHSDWWGRMELGVSGRVGKHGGESTQDPNLVPLDGLNRNRTWAQWHDAWFYYAPGGPVRGLWLRAEGSWIRDRNTPGSVINLEGSDLDAGGGVITTANVQTNPTVSSVYGGYIALGYKMSESRWADDCGSWLRNFEFALRADTFTNVQVAALVDPNSTDRYRTNVYTAGINYYIKGHDAKIQLNYNNVHNPEGGAHNFKNVDSDSFVVNFQVAF
jgi:hypothetical protein